MFFGCARGRVPRYCFAICTRCSASIFEYPEVPDDALSISVYRFRFQRNLAAGYHCQQDPVSHQIYEVLGSGNHGSIENLAWCHRMEYCCIHVFLFASSTLEVAILLPWKAFDAPLRLCCMPPPFYCEVIGQNIGVAGPSGTGWCYRYTSTAWCIYFSHPTLWDPAAVDADKERSCWRCCFPRSMATCDGHCSGDSAFASRLAAGFWRNWSDQAAELHIVAYIESLAMGWMSKDSSWAP